MAGIDILSIEPHAIERGLAGKSVLVFGKPKTGKTSLSAMFPKPLLLAFEAGYNMIGGIKAQKITSWSDAKLVLRQLRTAEAQKMYSTIIIDTVSIAYALCEKYVCSANSVQKIGDIPWGGGYSQVKKEMEEYIREIPMLGYGLVLIAHSKSHFEEGPNDTTIEIIEPDMPKRCEEVCNGTVDIIGYIKTEWKDGISSRTLITRQTPTIFAGSRLKYLAPEIPFGYNELCEAIDAAIDKEALDGATVIDKAEDVIVTTLNYDDVYKHSFELWQKLVLSDPDNPNEDVAKRVLKKAEMIFGHPIKLSEVEEDQVDLLNLVNLEMEDMLKLNS